MNDELKEKVSKLPGWARDLIHRLQSANEPMIEEVSRARKELSLIQERNRRLKESNEALLEILRKAAIGGSDFARVVVDTLDAYEIYKNPDS